MILYGIILLIYISENYDNSVVAVSLVLEVKSAIAVMILS